MQYKFILDITLSDGGASAEDVVVLYKGSIRDDIDQVAWNMCEEDDLLQSKKFGNLVLEDWSINHEHGGHILVKCQFTVNSSDDEFINQVIVNYMDGFANFISVTLNGYFSRTGERIGFNPNPLEWNMDFE
jgi:hypothetical protein